VVQHADLSRVSQKPWNDIVTDDRGNAYVNSIGFDFPGGQIYSGPESPHPSGRIVAFPAPAPGAGSP